MPFNPNDVRPKKVDGQEVQLSATERARVAQEWNDNERENRTKDRIRSARQTLISGLAAIDTQYTHHSEQEAVTMASTIHKLVNIGAISNSGEAAQVRDLFQAYLLDTTPVSFA